MIDDYVNIEHTEGTEQKILLAARKVFLRKGKAAASMQDIADEAGIARPLLHYYFRSKDRLFEAILKAAIGELVPSMAAAMISGKSLEDKMEAFVDAYIDTLLGNPHLPHFFLHELSVNPDRILGILKEMGLSSVVVQMMTSQLVSELDIPEDPRNLMIDLLGMMVFPFIAKPIVMHIGWEGDEEAYMDFLMERKQHIKSSMALLVRNARKRK